MKFLRFFASVSYTGESEFVNLRHLYILSRNLFEFITSVVIHGFFFMFIMIQFGLHRF